MSVSFLMQVALQDNVTRTAFSSTADFEVRSPKLLNVCPLSPLLCVLTRHA
jgi:hypothetical protein